MNLSQIIPLAVGSALVLLLVSAQCREQSTPPSTVPAEVLPYDLNAPALTINLASGDLKEISALSPTSDPNIFIAVSDERGEALFLNVKNGGAITKRVLFRDKGDFEGAEMVGDHIFCLESKGIIFEVTNWENGAPQVQEYPLGGLSKENDLEGLGYDHARNALLIACKEDPESDIDRRIFAFDLTTHQLSAEPVYIVHPHEVNALVAYNDEDKRKHFFSSSGVAVHPLTNDIYVISTALKRLVVLDHTTGKIRLAARLEKAILPQPEGISFDPAGNMYISSEGKTGEGLILEFLYHGGKN